MYKLILLMILSCSLMGCSLIPKINFNRPNLTPTSTTKNSNLVRCEGEMTQAPDGTVISCSKGYYNNSQNFKQDERKFTLQERIANFIRNLTGWGFWILILLCVFTPFGGAIVGGILNNMYGIGSKGVRMLVTGLQKGKKYVRENGTNYTETERIAYNRGMNDLLSKVSEEIKDPKVKKHINILRSEVN